MSDQSHDMEELADAPEAAPQGLKDPVDGATQELEHDDAVDGQVSS